MNAEEREVMYQGLIELLRTKGPLSVADIAAMQGIKLQAAYKRMQALHRQGIVLTAQAVPNGGRGPRKTLFGLAPTAQSQLVEPLKDAPNLSDGEV